MDAAIETPEARQARQFADMRELAELGMDLARDAYAAAKGQMFTPTAEREADRAVTFVAMAGAVRAVVALELRIERRIAEPRVQSFRLGRAASAAPDDPTEPARAPAAMPLRPLTDPRRVVLRRLLHGTVGAAPDRRLRRREINVAIDRMLGADPNGRRSLNETLAALCHDLGIDPESATLRDHLRDWVPANPVPS